MISREQVLDIFSEAVPDDVMTVLVDSDAYLEYAVKHPFIQSQIRVGIYTEDNIATDFLSPAVAFPDLRVLHVCYDLLESHAEGVDDDLTLAYVTNMALHEAHHFESHGPRPTNVVEHSHAELHCIEEIKAKFPDLDAAVQEFERQSPVYQRVYARMGVRI